MGHFIQRSSPCAFPRISCWHDSGTDCECMLLSFTCFTCKSWKVYRKLNRPAGLSRLKIINKLDLRAVYHIKLRFVALLVFLLTITFYISTAISKRGCMKSLLAANLTWTGRFFSPEMSSHSSWAHRKRSAYERQSQNTSCNMTKVSFILM